MKNALLKSGIFLILTIFAFQSSLAQSNANEPQIGEKFVIQEATTSSYKAIHFPKLNLLMKRGAIASYAPAENKVVEIVEVKKNRKGENIVVLEHVDGKNILTGVKSVRANYQKALRLGELEAYGRS